MRAFVAGAVAIVRRDAAIYFSYRLRLASQAALSLFSLALFYYLSRLVNVPAFPTPDDYFAYVVVGLVVLHSLSATLAQVPNALRTELVAGTFERVAAAPLGPSGAVAAMTFFPSLVAVATGVVTLAFAVLLFGFDLQGANTLLAVPAACLAVLAFLPFALLVGAVVLVSKQAGTIGNLVVVALSLAGGVYFPPRLLPEWIRWTSDVQPFTAALDLLRHLLTDTPTTTGPATAMARLVGFALVMLPLSVVVLRAAAGFCRRRGTLTEY